MKSKRSVLLTAAVGVALGCLGTSSCADTVTFNAIAGQTYGGVTAYGPGVYKPGEIGGEFLFSVNKNTKNGSSYDGLNAILRVADPVFKTFCVDVSDNISTGVEYYVSLDTSIPPTILHTGVGGSQVSAEMAYVADAYRRGLFNSLTGAGVTNNLNDIAAGVQLELWYLLGTPGTGTTSSNAERSAIATYANAHSSDWAASQPYVGVINLYNINNDTNHTQGSLAQSQIVYLTAPSGGTTDAPLPGVLWAGLPLMGAVAVRRKLSGRRSV